ncbi:hypothetical protein TWF569_000687 [Orbilia oligospora]|uniref:ABC transporter domain-containing protein n=1 Tax=Orbilia oligospora TaxID=2813651 RepID=A0A7C8N2F2_ORBOL|nr:hypothetical protein TWF102_003551 [Orbilia oligospora]KAF3082781.1 hypothetical protein TWF103_003092 [Orbilia oligospora]KAF3121545.1 hypothetical protein TWF594_003178 [Orbilia oligospora]KAF3125948.1 hypothetical protein TWF569_000687 [Orbilia oligospora]
MASLYRQTYILTKKNLRIVALRHSTSTIFRAFFLPVAFAWFLAYAKNLFIPVSKFGFGDPAPIRGLADTVDKKLLFVDNNLGPIVTDVIDRIVQPVRDAGRAEVVVLRSNDELFQACRPNLAGQSNCFGAVVFNEFPSDGQGKWNYTIRADAALLFGAVRSDNHDNPAQRVIMPLQLAVDNAINNSTVIPNEFLYTSLSEEERKDRIRTRYMGALINVLAVAFSISMVGVSYHLTGMLATERQIGMSQLINSMGGRQWARLLSHHFAFSLVYLPGWIMISLAFAFAVFQKTNAGIVVIFHILTGLAFSSLSLLGGSFFKKAQLSGITIVIGSLLLAIVAQVVSKLSTGATAILGVLFTPMSYVYFMILVARFERENIGTNLLERAPTSKHTLPGIVFFVFLILQIIIYPVLAAFVESWLYGTASPNRTIGTTSEENAIEIEKFTRKYPPSWWSRRSKETVVAVNDLSVNVRKGCIVSLLGANGSGKSTTNNAISGLDTISSGEIRISGVKTDLGVCPQNNVLWDDLSVLEHLRVWQYLKVGYLNTEEIDGIVKSCDLLQKKDALAKTLSGGQKRKLQLAIMFIGGSKIGIVDEASSGLDPLSRRKLWDIILSERNKRTILLTTHYLEEADFLSDYIVILSKGQLKCTGSSAELKAIYGGGYRVHCFDDSAPPMIEGIPGKQLYDQTIYRADDTIGAGTVIKALNDLGMRDFHINGPTIEDVFLKVALETAAARVSVAGTQEKQSKVELSTGKRVGMIPQALIMFQKRLVILRHSLFPMITAVLIPILAAGITLRFLKGFEVASCDPSAAMSNFENVNISSLDIDVDIVFGPPESVGLPAAFKLQEVFGGFSESPMAGSDGFDVLSLLNNTHVVNSYDSFISQIRDRYKEVLPGGFWLQDGAPTLGFVGNDGGLYNALLALNILDNLRDNATIITTYTNFDVSFAPGTGDSLQFITYFALGMSVFPAFFVLYPTLERLRNVRALHYSNGVRAGSLWIAYTLFDFMFILVISVVVTVILVASTSVWWNIGHLFAILLLYGLAAVLFAYIVSLLAKSQLAAFAMVSGYNAVLFLLYMIGYMSVLTYSPIADQNRNIIIVHFALSIISPVPSFVRGLFASLNLFQIDCRDDAFVPPQDMIAYGGPILYLVIQIIIYFSIMVWWESGAYRLDTRRILSRTKDTERDATETDKEVFEELKRVDSSTSDGLRVLHVSKSFGNVQAVEDVSFGVKPGEIFALLGPNGAGKSTTISMIRGVLRPDLGDIFVQGLKMHSKDKPEARSHLGVCPQFDACDQMTTREHLRFYAKIRGVVDIDHNVQVVLDAAGLTEFSERMAWKLSGGNRRKLSLAIALMGNPSVMLLDEPSSSMDSASQRLLWNILRSIAPGRSLLLTSHSMLEVDALANRAGIVSRKMLAVGTTDYLREKHGNHYHIHIVLKSSPNTPDEEMESVKSWILNNFQGAEVEDKSFHGQTKFKVPSAMKFRDREATADDGISKTDSQEDNNKAKQGNNTINTLFQLLEENKENLGIDFYSISRTSMDEVFLNIVGNANVIEEGYQLEQEESRKKPTVRWRGRKGKKTDGV